MSNAIALTGAIWGPSLQNTARISEWQPSCASQCYQEYYDYYAVNGSACEVAAFVSTNYAAGLTTCMSNCTRDEVQGLIDGYMASCRDYCGAYAFPQTFLIP